MSKKKKKGKQIQLHLSPEKYIRTKARLLPIHKCLITKGWEFSKIANVVVTRKHSNGNITAGMYLVDLAELGTKDAHYKFNSNEDLFFDEINSYTQFGSLEEIPYELAHNIIYQGIEFREDIAGLKPPKEFEVAQYVLEKEDEIEYMEDLPFQWFIDDAGDDYFEDEEGLDECLSRLGLPEDYSEWNQLQWQTFIEDDSVFVAEVIESMFEIIAEEKYPEYLEMVDKELDMLNVVTYFPGELNSLLNEDEKEAMLQLGEMIGDEEAEAESGNLVELSEKMVEKFPWNETFHYHLVEVYELAEQKNKSQKALDNMLEKFPDSILAKIRKGLALIAEGQWEDVPAIFNGNESLYNLLPERKAFNLLEVIGFHTIMTIYFIGEMDVLKAIVHSTIVEDIEAEFQDEGASNTFEEDIYLEVLMLKAREVMEWVESKEG